MTLMPTVTLYANGSARLSQPMISSMALFGLGHYVLDGDKLTVTYDEGPPQNLPYPAAEIPCSLKIQTSALPRSAPFTSTNRVRTISVPTTKLTAKN
jgi:hypothetical protein